MPNFVSNKELLAELIKSQSAGRITERMGEMMLLMVNRFSQKPNFRQYSWLDEMKSTALVSLCGAVFAFDTNRSSQVFSYFTTCAMNAFLKVLKTEHRVMASRDDALIAANMTPSTARQLEMETNRSSEPIISKKRKSTKTPTPTARNKKPKHDPSITLVRVRYVDS